MAATVSNDTREDNHDEVRLALPADPEFGRIARIAISGLALRHGFDYAAVEDLRIAIDESLILLLGSTGHPGRIIVTYRLADNTMSVTMTADFTDRKSEDAAGWDDDGEHRFDMLVTDLVDDIDLDRAGHRLTITKSTAD